MCDFVYLFFCINRLLFLPKSVKFMTNHIWNFLNAYFIITIIIIIFINTLFFYWYQQNSIFFLTNYQNISFLWGWSFLNEQMFFLHKCTIIPSKISKIQECLSGRNQKEKKDARVEGKMKIKEKSEKYSNT